MRSSWITSCEQECANTRAGYEPADVVGEQRELPCLAGRNLVQVVEGDQEPEMVFVAPRGTDCL